MTSTDFASCPLQPLKTESMTKPRTADTVLTETFLEVRAKLLEVAATLDRIDRAAAEEAPLGEDGRQQRAKIDRAVQLLLADAPDRAAQLQQLFSRGYESDWREQMKL